MTRWQMWKWRLKTIRKVWKDLCADNSYKPPTSVAVEMLNDENVRKLMHATSTFLKRRYDGHTGIPTRDDMALYVRAATGARQLAVDLAKAPSRWPQRPADEWFNIITGWQLRTTHVLLDPLDLTRTPGQDPRERFLGEYRHDTGKDGQQEREPSEGAGIGPGETPKAP